MSASLPWIWVIDTLTDCVQPDIDLLRALIFRDSAFSTLAPEPVRERVALRCLEELVDVDQADGPSVWASIGEIDVKLSCKEVLFRVLRKFCQLASLLNLEKDRVNLLTHDLHKFILHKRASLSKSSLDKIKAAILEGQLPVSLPLKESSGFPIQNGVDYPQCNVGVESQRANKIQVSIHDTEIQSLRPSSAPLAAGNSIELLQEDHTRSIQLLKQNAADFDRMLQRNDVNTGGNHQISNDFTEIERRKKIKLSTKENSRVLAPGSSTSIYREDPSESMQQNGADVDLVITRANDEANGQDSMCELPNRENINAGDDHAHLMKDASITWQPCNGDESLQHASINRSGENMNPAFCEKSHLNGQLGVTPKIARGNGSDDVPFYIEQNDDVFAAVRRYLLSSQVNINYDSAIGDCTEQGLCIKCNKSGELLTCNGSSCFISVHETCLGSSSKFEMSEPFYCPFCSYVKVATEYRKQKQLFVHARKVLLEFIGGDFVQENENKSPSNEQNQQVEHAPACDRKEDTSPIQNANCDLSEGDIDPSTNKEQVEVEVAEHQQLGEPRAAADNVHLTCGGDPCHARYVHEDGQGDDDTSNDHSNIQQLKTHEEEEDNDTVDVVPTGEKHGKRGKQDASVADNNVRNKPSSGNSGRHGFRAKRYSNPILPPSRRSKLFWTTEEEEVLKEAVQSMAEKSEGNISWVEILELGHHVFHKTRQPGDLKDKWRNMKKKEASRTPNA